MKHRIISVLIMLAVWTVPVFAQDNTIAIGAIRATLTLPEGGERIENEETLISAQSPRGTLMTLSVQNGDVSKSQWNLDLYEDSECEKLEDSLVETLGKGGYENVEGSLMKQDGVKWLRFAWETSGEEGQRYGVQYYTAMNGQAITAAFTSDQKLEAEELEEIDGIIASVHFAEIQERPAKSENDWTVRIIWISLLIVAGLVTYMITTRRQKKR